MYITAHARKRIKKRKLDPDEVLRVAETGLRIPQWSGLVLVWGRGRIGVVVDGERIVTAYKIKKPRGKK